MTLKDLPFQQKLIAFALVTSGVVLLLTCAAFFASDFLTFRQTTLTQLSTLADVIADNSTAALAFENRDDAREILTSLKAERHIVSAALYNKNGELFSHYPKNMAVEAFPPVPQRAGFQF